MYFSTWQYMLVHVNPSYYMTVNTDTFCTGVFWNTFCIRIRAPLHRIVTIIINNEILRSLFRMIVIHHKASYMTAVNSQRNGCRFPS